jgi:DNA topoisomerase-1
MGGYVIEPPTLFRGRGQHPKNGFLKPRTYPEDITINIALDAPVPKCDVPGRAWKEITHNNEVTWLAYSKDEVINSSFKYIFLSSNSQFKSISDIKKFEKARKLNSKISSIRQDYQKKIESKHTYERQLGTVTYLIDKLAIRVGNEKNAKDEADTVGCCSLRIEHIKLLEDDQINLNFLGKDSIVYDNTVAVQKNVYECLKTFMLKKGPKDLLFDTVNPSKLNEYLQTLMPGLTAKVFRTFNASSTLQ